MISSAFFREEKSGFFVIFNNFLNSAWFQMKSSAISQFEVPFSYFEMIRLLMFSGISAPIFSISNWLINQKSTSHKLN
ncbi:hypothetical protein M153_15100010486 [Pseudoloma neurophilia]|uniref:Uncharacterized protein n=1 Tax=Pseudoloma neurophilia TaxID=146866 RepID=A0A0R0LZP0_9MICR|nr:hypothetical protein M153_15100010486 [Pseudoloma neurophilia]